MRRYAHLHASIAHASIAMALLAGACSTGLPMSTPEIDAAADIPAGWEEDASVPDGGDTWVSWDQGFFAKYCVECHGPSDPTGLDFTQQSIVVTNKLTIRCGIAATQDPSWDCASFPPPEQFPLSDSSGHNPKPSPAERLRVIAWIDGGCP
jgi:hypothetical protein